MDEIEQTSIDHIPMRSLSLRLARSTIKMQHNAGWKIDKVNPVHDLIIGLSGSGAYRIGESATAVTVGAGDALLIPAYTRFRGVQTSTDTPFTGIAQHFTLDLFGKGDLIKQLMLAPVIRLPEWETLGPLVALYRAQAPHGSTTLSQHHQFMVVLLAYLNRAFTGWNREQAAPQSQDHLSVQIMMVASRLSMDPLGGVLDEAMRDLPYNPDYFRRAFKDRMGLTPQKFREMKRMEFAASRLGMGVNVKAVAAELGYDDPYYFSRMFKRYLGSSPSTYRERPSRKH